MKWSNSTIQYEGRHLKDRLVARDEALDLVRLWIDEAFWAKDWERHERLKIVMRDVYRCED